MIQQTVLNLLGCLHAKLSGYQNDKEENRKFHVTYGFSITRIGVIFPLPERRTRRLNHVKTRVNDFNLKSFVDLKFFRFLTNHTNINPITHRCFSFFFFTICMIFPGINIERWYGRLSGKKYNGHFRKRLYPLNLFLKSITFDQSETILRHCSGSS